MGKIAFEIFLACQSQVGAFVTEWPKRCRGECFDRNCNTYNISVMTLITRVVPDLIFFQIRLGPDLGLQIRPGPGPGQNVLELDA